MIEVLTDLLKNWEAKKILKKGACLQAHAARKGVL